MFTTETRPPSEFKDLKVTIMGLGLFGGGRGVTEFFVKQGARVTVTDKRSASVLAPAIEEVRDLPVRWVLGEHRDEDFLHADLVVPNPAVPRDAPLLQACKARGIPLDTEMNLFFKYCRGKICAITGSNGKTTTTSLVGAMATVRWPTTRVGGNLGRSLLPEVESISPGEWVVLELSSFQLEDLAALRRRPEISVITNVSPNHLDRHRTYDAYLDAKRLILEPGGAPNVAVLNAEDAVVRTWAGPDRRVVFFGRSAGVLPGAPGVWFREDQGEVLSAERGSLETLFPSSDLHLVGRFNVLNAAAAAAAALSIGIAPLEIREAVRAFQPVEHRLEFVREMDGIQYLNDSIATTPESTMVALEALGPDVVLICGGSSKGSSFQRLGQVIFHRARAVVLLGQTADSIRAAIPSRPGGPRIQKVGSLEDAVHLARSFARPGDRVILSPSCASYDMFLNFVERGRRFKEIVMRLAPRA